MYRPYRKIYNILHAQGNFASMQKTITWMVVREGVPYAWSSAIFVPCTFYLKCPFAHSTQDVNIHAWIDK